MRVRAQCPHATTGGRAGREPRRPPDPAAAGRRGRRPRRDRRRAGRVGRAPRHARERPGAGDRGGALGGRLPVRTPGGGRRPTRPSGCSPSPRRCAATPAPTSSWSWTPTAPATPTPTPSRSARPFVGDLGGAPRGRGLHPGVRRHAGAVGPRGRARRRRRRGRRPRRGRHQGRPARPPALGDLPGHQPRRGRDPARRAARRLADLAAAAPPDARHGRARDHPDVRVLPGRPRRGARGPAARRLRAARAAGQRRGPSACSPCPTTSRAARSTSSACRPGLVAAVEQRTAVADQTYVLGQQVLVLSTSPAYWDQAEVGAVVTVRDRTELQAVTGELDLVRGLTESLRSQNHEAANRLHTIVSLVEMGRAEQAVEFATAELEVAQGLADELVSAVDEPVLAALLLGKTAQAAERGIDLEIAGEPARRAPRRRRATWSPSSATSSTTPSTPSPRPGPPRRSGCASAWPATPTRLHVEVDDSGLRHRARGPRARARARLVEQGPGGPRARAGDGRPGRLPARRHARGHRLPARRRAVRGRRTQPAAGAGGAT